MRERDVEKKEEQRQREKRSKTMVKNTFLFTVRRQSRKQLLQLVRSYFFMLVLLVEYIFLTNFYGLYFNHQLHNTITISSSSYRFMLTFLEQLSCTASKPVFLIYSCMVLNHVTLASTRSVHGTLRKLRSVPDSLRKLKVK